MLTWLLTTAAGRGLLALLMSVGVLTGLWAAHTYTVRRAYERGRVYEQQRAANLVKTLDSTVVADKAASDAARATLDSSLQTTRQALAKAQRALQSAKQVPGAPTPAPSRFEAPADQSGPARTAVATVAVDTQPIQQALRACSVLANDCAAFRARAVAERASSDARYLGLSVQYGARGDTIQRWRGRVTKKKALAGGALAALLGWCVGGGCR